MRTSLCNMPRNGSRDDINQRRSPGFNSDPKDRLLRHDVVSEL